MTDEQLMIDVRGGSREAFEMLFERYRGLVWRFFRRRVATAARAEELAQDVFVAILVNAPGYEPRAAFRSYLFGIAYNLLLAERRQAARHPAEAVTDVAAPDAHPDDSLWITRALATLDTDHREILMLREYEQLSYLEIANLLHIPLNTVRSRLLRARIDLRTALSPAAATPVKASQ